MIRAWRVLRAVLLCPVTPLVLAAVLLIDAYKIADSTGLYRHSTIGEYLRGPFGIAHRGGSWWPTNIGTVIRKPDGTIELQISDSTPIVPGTWMAGFRYSSRTSQSGFYACTSRNRRVGLTLSYLSDIEQSVLSNKLDEYVEYIISHPDIYECSLDDRGSLRDLNLDINAYRPDPSVEYRAVSETDILWPGYLHNILAATALLALLISTPWSLCTIPGRIRRWRYKRPGCCHACGYDISGVPHATTCPECGTTTTPDSSPRLRPWASCHGSGRGRARSGR